MPKKLTDTERESAAEIVAWFSALIHAWRTGDLTAAGEAQQELAERGVNVKIPRQLTTQKGGK